MKSFVLCIFTSVCHVSSFLLCVSGAVRRVPALGLLEGTRGRLAEVFPVAEVAASGLFSQLLPHLVEVHLLNINFLRLT